VRASGSGALHSETPDPGRISGTGRASAVERGRLVDYLHLD